MNATTAPEEWWNKGDHIWADGARKMGFDLYPGERAFRNAFGGSDRSNRFDSKGNTLPWAYIGMNHGLKIIANAEVEKVIIEKVPGGRPVAKGAIYKDKAGNMHEVRAARVIVAMGTVWGPMMLYRSGYGPKDYLGTNLIVQNENVGRNMSADCDYRSTGYLAEPIDDTGIGSDFPGETMFAATEPRPWKALHIRFYGGGIRSRNPEGTALNIFAPQLGWEHKEYMRNGHGVSRTMNWNCHLCAIPWTWRIRPDGLAERTSIDLPAFNKTVKQGEEWIRAWHEKLPVKVIKADMRYFARNPDAVRPQHMTGTTRAGSDPATSVCTSDFDCHDIDNLILTSGSTIPKTFLWAAGPVAVTACYAYRRIIENHFTTGCSTKGFA